MIALTTILPLVLAATSVVPNGEPGGGETVTVDGGEVPTVAPGLTPKLAPVRRKMTY